MRPRGMLMERIFSRMPDRLLAVGEMQREQLMSVFGFSDRRIGTIFNGVTLRNATGDGAFRETIGAGDRILVGTIATFIEQKGLRDLLTVAKLLRDRGHRVLFVVVGEGHLRSELEAQRHQLGLDDSVVFTGWITDAADVALPTFDVFFQPSLWEAMSMVILEAMAAGKAIVATRVGENPRVIQDGVDGLLVAPKDLDGMASALGRVVEDAALRARLGAAARRKVEERFTVEHMTRAYERVYLEAGR
jgi:glycosyltransferase involved in cell wall biosynthesis